MEVVQEGNFFLTGNLFDGFVKGLQATSTPVSRKPLVISELGARFPGAGGGGTPILHLTGCAAQ